MEQTNQIRTNHQSERMAEKFQLEQRLKSKGNLSACRDSQRCLQQSIDQFRRANRDLGELAAFVVASLTTVTVIEAVINIAVEKIGLAREILQAAFHSYIGFLALILILGILRFGIVVCGDAPRPKKKWTRRKEVFSSFASQSTGQNLRSRTDAESKKALWSYHVAPNRRRGFAGDQPGELDHSEGSV